MSCACMLTPAIQDCLRVSFGSERCVPLLGGMGDGAVHRVEVPAPCLLRCRQRCGSTAGLYDPAQTRRRTPALEAACLGHIAPPDRDFVRGSARPCTLKGMMYCVLTLPRKAECEGHGVWAGPRLGGGAKPDGGGERGPAMRSTPAAQSARILLES
jgi:hypothetical protein